PGFRAFRGQVFNSSGTALMCCPRACFGNRPPRSLRVYGDGRRERRVGLLRRGGRRSWEEDFAAYYAARGDMLRRTAYLLCGDWHLAEDLTQTAFTNLYRAWNRLDRHDALDQYTRRVLVRAFLDERRRPWRR